jgi:hypothetical protein
MELQDDPTMLPEIQKGLASPAYFAGKFGPGGTEPNTDAMELFAAVQSINVAAKEGMPFDGVVTSSIAAKPDVSFSMALGNVFEKIQAKESSNAINFAMGTFIDALRTINPQFGSKQQHGDHDHGYQQQDAAEAWGQLMSCLIRAVPFSKDVFTYRNEITMTCDENPDEPAKVSTEDGTVRVFRHNFLLDQDAIGSHACSLEANMRVTNGIPLGCPLLLPVGTVNRVQTRKDKQCWPTLTKTPAT